MQGRLNLVGEAEPAQRGRLGEKEMKEDRTNAEQLLYPWDVGWERRKAKAMRMLKPARARES